MTMRSPAALRLEQAYRTHPGTVRAVNEDAGVVRLQAGLWAIADGMGGHERGQWASRTIADALEHIALPLAIEGAADAVTEALNAANATIWAATRKSGAPIGSTVAVLLIRDDRYVVLWAGDSRVYRHRAGTLTQLTTDHTEVERMIARGLLDRRDAADHPFRNMLARSVGTSEALLLDRIEGSLAGGDVFLLCSDGLSGMVDDREIRRALVSASPDRVAQLLLDRALERGAQDNVTVTIIGCEQATQIGALLLEI